MNSLVLSQKIYDYLVYIYPIIGRYPKFEKFTLQMQTKNCILGLQRAVVKADKSSAKKSNLYEADALLVELNMLMRLAHDLEYISTQSYETSSRKLKEIGRLLGGFIKHVQSKTDK